MTERVVDLASFKAKLRGGSRFDPQACKHSQIIVDEDLGTIECNDCKKSLSAFHVLVRFCRDWSKIGEEIQQMKERLTAMRRLMRDWNPRLRALKELEKSWWRGNSLPCCPHCSRGLMAEDFVNGGHHVGREIEIAQRKRDAAGECR